MPLLSNRLSLFTHRDFKSSTALLRLSTVMVACTLLWLSACSKTAAPSAGNSGGAPPPVQVGVVTVSQGDVGLVTELPGRLEASRIAQVRARAAGILQERLFREGSDVKAGQRLFRIDAAPYAAAAASARAGQAKAEANLAQAFALAERYKPLVEANAISKQDYAAAVSAQKQAEADVALGKASVQTANINLGYASVTAPISGRIGRTLVTEGALVGQGGDATQLAVIQQINPMYVNFTQSASDVLKLRKAMAAGQFKRANGSDAASVRIVLEDGSIYPQAGKLLFSDLTVDSTTGQITLRAEVPNDGGQLLPGLYVRVRLEQALATNAILLPQQAVARAPLGDSVMVVDAEGKVATRPVKIGGAKDSQWVVLEGLKSGEQVVVDGFQKIQPKATVKPVPWTPVTSASAPTASTAMPVASAPAAAASVASSASAAAK